MPFATRRFSAYKGRRLMHAAFAPRGIGLLPITRVIGSLFGYFCPSPDKVKLARLGFLPEAISVSVQIAAV